MAIFKYSKTCCTSEPPKEAMTYKMARMGMQVARFHNGALPGACVCIVLSCQVPVPRKIITSLLRYDVVCAKIDEI